MTSEQSDAQTSALPLSYIVTTVLEFRRLETEGRAVDDRRRTGPPDCSATRDPNGT